MTADEALELGEEIIEMIENEVPEWALDKATEFFESVGDSVREVMDKIEDRGWATEGEAEALQNWKRGVAKWIR